MFFALIFSISSCVILMTPAKEKQEKGDIQSIGIVPSYEEASPAQYATIRPDQQPLQDYPQPSNWEFYSQKGGTPLRRASVDSVGKNFRPDIFLPGDTTRRNKFIEHGDSVYYYNFYGDSLLLGLQTGGGGSVAIPFKYVGWGTGSGLTGSSKFQFDTTGSDVQTTLTNPATGTGDDNRLKLISEAGAGDPQLNLSVGASGTTYYYLGVDNSASDAFFLGRTTSAQSVGAGTNAYQLTTSGQQIMYYQDQSPAVVIDSDNTTMGAGNESVQVAPDVVTITSVDGADASTLEIQPASVTINTDGTVGFLYPSSNPAYSQSTSSVDLSSDDGTGYLTLSNTSVGLASGSTDFSMDEASSIITMLASGGISAQSSGGNVLIGGGNTASELRLFEPAAGGSNYTSLRSGTMSASQTYTFPTDTPADGEFLAWHTGGNLSWDAGGGGSGTVTSFSAGNLSPLFTSNVATATTTPALTFSLSNQTANTVFAGPSSGGAAAPTFRALAAADIPATAPGDFFKDGGNSFGATAIVGTNDANTLALEVNNTTRASINTSGVWNVTDESATTNDVVVRQQIGTNCSGTPTTGFGTRSEFYAESNTTVNRLQGAIQTRWSTVSDGTRSSEMDFITVSSGAEAANLTIEANGDVGIVQTSPAHRLTNTGTQITDGTTVSATGFGWSISSTNNYMSGFTNSSTSTAAHGLLVEANATDNDTRALTVSVGSGPTRAFVVTCDQRVGVLDETPESQMDITGTTSTNHLIGQNLTPTIAAESAAGSGASASIVTAQSSDLAGRFTVTTGTGATAGNWVTVTFDDAFAVIPTVVLQPEFIATDNNIRTNVAVSTTGFEMYVTASSTFSDSATYQFAYQIIGGK